MNTHIDQSDTAMCCCGDMCALSMDYLVQYIHKQSDECIARRTFEYTLRFVKQPLLNCIPSSPNTDASQARICVGIEIAVIERY